MSHRSRPAAGVLAAVLLAASAAGCGDPAPTPPPSAPVPSVAPSTGPESASVAPSLSATAAPSPSVLAPSSSVSTSSPAAGVAVEDPSLIAVLPADIDGVPLTLEPQAFTEAMADRAFATNVASAAFGVVVSGNDLASAVVAKPIPGVFSEAWFRDWRDTYDQGACAQSGGVARNAQAEMGARKVYITTCAGGLRTYHTWIDGRGLIVSAFAIGENGFGERLMEGLRP